MGVEGAESGMVAIIQLIQIAQFTSVMEGDGPLYSCVQLKLYPRRRHEDLELILQFYLYI
jgi:hypothetical protein